MDLGIRGTEQVEEIGRGGFAVVYKAWQPAFERNVAIKVLTQNVDDMAAQRFERECTAIGALSGHPNIVTVYDVGQTNDNRPYILMEYLADGSLADVLARGGHLPWEDAVSVGIKMAGALESAHHIAVLHRDVKPENILMSRYGEPKLADFGIARIEGKAETRSGLITASPHHAPPEILDGARASVAADVYSLASTMFALIVGHGPFDREDDTTVFAIFARIANSDVPDIREYDVPDEVATVLERALSKDPASRPQTAAVFGNLLRDAQVALGLTPTPIPIEQGTTGSAPLPPPPPAATTGASERPKRGQTSIEERGRRIKRSFVLSGIAAVALIVGVVALVVFNGKGKGGTGGRQANASKATTTLVPARVAQGAVIDHFSSSSSGWENTTDADGRRIYQDGQYLVEAVRKQQALLSFRGDAPNATNSKTEVAAQVAPGSQGFGVYGLSCRYQRLNGRSYYLATISGDGQWGIYRQRADAPSMDALAAGNIALSRGSHRLEFTCSGTPTSLQLLVDGNQVGAAEDATPLPGGKNGLVVVSLGDAPFAALFDDYSFTPLD